MHHNIKCGTSISNSFIFFNFHVDEPNNGDHILIGAKNEDCIFLWSYADVQHLGLLGALSFKTDVGNWGDAACNTKFWPICKKDLGKQILCTVVIST